MHLRARLTLGIGFGVAMAATACIVAGMWFVGHLVEDSVGRQLDSGARQFAAEIVAQGQKARALARFVASTPEVVERFATGDRETLTKQFLPAFETLKAEGIDQFQFHLPPATSFLRLHKPAKFGDDLSSFRATVVEANRDRHVVTGLESGVQGIGIRSVVPVARAGKAIGTVEFGAAFGREFVADFGARTGLKLALVIDPVDGKGERTLLASNFPEGHVFSAEDLARAAAGRTAFGTLAVGGANWQLLGEPLLDYSGRRIGAVMLAADRTSLEAVRTQAIMAFGVVAVMLAIGGLIAGFWLEREIGRPIVRLTSSVDRISGGDFTTVVPTPTGIDEIAAMTRAVEALKTALERQAASEETRHRDLAARNDRVRRREERTQAFDATIRGLLGEMGEVAARMTSTADEMTGVSTRTTDRSREAAAQAQETAGTVGSVARASEELGSTLAEIQRRIQHSSTIASRARSETEGAGDVVRTLAASGDRIGEVVGLINAIAGQTNLLALNATIEAARAGEAGRGFAIVASEVKQLAAETTKATESIAEQVAHIQAETHRVVEAIGSIGTVIDELATVGRDITGVVDVQDRATREIASAIHRAVAAAGRVSQGIGVVEGDARETATAASAVMATARELAACRETLDREIHAYVADVKSA